MVQPPGSLCVTQTSSAPWEGAVTGEVAAAGPVWGRTMPALGLKTLGAAPKPPGRHSWSVQRHRVCNLLTGRAGLRIGKGCSPAPGKRQSPEPPEPQTPGLLLPLHSVRGVTLGTGWLWLGFEDVTEEQRLQTRGNTNQK